MSSVRLNSTIPLSFFSTKQCEECEASFEILKGFFSSKWSSVSSVRLFSEMIIIFAHGRSSVRSVRPNSI